MNADELGEMLLDALSLSGKRVLEDDIMRRMGKGVASFVVGVTGNEADDNELMKVAFICFELGYMAHEEGWADLSDWN